MNDARAERADPLAGWDEVRDLEEQDRLANGKPRPGIDVPPDTPEWRAFLADMGWVEDEYAAGRWDRYVGNYIAVADKQLLGYGPDLTRLHAQVEADHPAVYGRAVVTYIDPGIEC